MRNLTLALVALYGCEVVGPRVAAQLTSNDGYADTAALDLGDDATSAVQETSDATAVYADVTVTPDTETDEWVADAEDAAVGSGTDTAVEIQEDAPDVQLAVEVTTADTGPDPCAGANCDDGNTCTDDTCDKAKGCLHTANTLFCDDKNVCTTGDKCTAGACVAGSFAGLSPTCNCQFDSQCDDSDTCTADTCVNYNCVHTQPTCSCVSLTCELPFNSGYVCACVNICVKSDGCCANSIQGCVP